MPSPELSPAPTCARELVLALHDIRAVCLDGPYTLKSGLQSPIYIDLRMIISFPTLLQSVCSLLSSLLSPLHFTLICGVPYTALPIATLLSTMHDTPMIMRRKEVKAYGMKKSIEGTWDAHSPQRCLIVEDLVTSGLSVFETVTPIKDAGVDVQDVVVIIDREQGGRANIEQRGCRLHALLTISEVVRVLVEEGRIPAGKGAEVMDFIQRNTMEVTEDGKGGLAARAAVPAPAPVPTAAPLSYVERAALAQNPTAAALLRLMHEKQTNLCLSADVLTCAELLALADACGPHICLLKTHVDILEDFTPALIPQLQTLATRHRFLLFEDRKFADIGSTVAHQFHRGIYRISSWAHIVNAHLLPGPAILDGLSPAPPGAGVGSSVAAEAGVLLIAQMSSAGNLVSQDYTAQSVAVAHANARRVMGFICQGRLSNEPGLLHLTPGVSRVQSGDALGQRYNGVEECVQRGADVLIVGRGIYGAKGREAEEAQLYRQEGWAAYQQRLNPKQ